VVHCTLKALEDRGYIRRMPRRARAIELCHLTGEADFSCPNCGWRPAGIHADSVVGRDDAGLQAPLRVAQPLDAAGDPLMRGSAER